MKIKAVITGGGTAGHAVPMIEVGKELANRFYNIDLICIGNENYIEKKLSNKEGIPFFHVQSSGFEQDAGLKDYLNSLKVNLSGVGEAKKILKAEGVDFVISSGGFVSAPVLMAARLLRIPYYLLEQNKVIGRVNKLFLNGSEEIYCAFNETEGVSKNRGKVFGNPVKVKDGVTGGSDLVVLGGSGGSLYLNEWAVNFAKKNKDVNVHIQVGLKNLKEYNEKTKNLYNVELYGYTDIQDLLSKARVVVTRGGSSTLFELLNARLRSVIVPLPNSISNHQFKNAKYFEEHHSIFTAIEQGQDKKIDQKVLAILNRDDEDSKKPLPTIEYRESAYLIARDIFNNFYRKRKKAN